MVALFNFTVHWLAIDIFATFSAFIGFDRPNTWWSYVVHRYKGWVGFRLGIVYLCLEFGQPRQFRIQQTVYFFPWTFHPGENNNSPNMIWYFKVGLEWIHNTDQIQTNKMREYCMLTDFKPLNHQENSKTV